MRVAIERNLSAVYAHSRHLPSARFHENAERTWFGMNQPLEFYNVVLRAVFHPDTINSQVDATLAPFRERRVPVRWWIGPSTRPADLGEHLKATA
jgi:hypothetical protein